MKAICIIGGTGRGKSTYIKNLLAELPKAQIYDVNNEYKGLRVEPYELPEIEDFITRAEQTENQIFVFEEATIFFDHQSGNSKAMKRLLVRKRHQRNFYVFVFHAVRHVPADIIDFVDTFVVFKTNENIDYAIQKFRANELIGQTIMEVKQHPNFHFHKEI